jgi:hypothetical protein
VTGEYPIRITPGTQVVAGRNGPGIVVSHSENVLDFYLVRFPSGAEQEFNRDELRIRKHAQSDVLGPDQNGPTINLPARQPSDRRPVTARNCRPLGRQLSFQWCRSSLYDLSPPRTMDFIGP